MKMSSAAQGHDWMDWTNFVISAVSGLGTLLALLLACYLGFRQLEQFRTEQKQRDDEQRERDKERRQEQARCVSGRVFKDSRLTFEQTGSAQSANSSTAAHLTGPVARSIESSTVEVQNASPWPIYMVTAQVREGGPSYEVGRIIAGTKFMRRSLEGKPDKDALQGPPRRIHFRDAGNQWWCRNDDGLLEPLPHRPKLDVL